MFAVPVVHGEHVCREPAVLCCVLRAASWDPSASPAQPSSTLVWSSQPSPAQPGSAAPSVHTCQRSSVREMAGESFLLVVTRLQSP